jgi:hypothetical protein
MGKATPIRWAETEGGGYLTCRAVVTPRPHGGLKEILRSRKAPGAKVINPADGKKPASPNETK